MNDETRTPRSLKVAIGVVLILLMLGLILRLRSEWKLQRVRELQQALRDAPPEQRPEKFQQLRDGMQSLSQGDRNRIAADGRQRFEQEMIGYTRLSKSEKDKYLDERIDRTQRSDQNRNFGSGGPRPALSQEERDRRRKERLDQTSPEFRAAMDQFRRDMENRRKQRGLLR